MQHDHVLKKLMLVLLTPSPGSGGGEGRGLRAKSKLLPRCCIRNYIKFDIQHNTTMLLKKLNFDQLSPTLGLWGGGGGGGGGVAGKIFITMLLHI